MTPRVNLLKMSNLQYPISKKYQLNQQISSQFDIENWMFDISFLKSHNIAQRLSFEFFRLTGLAELRSLGDIAQDDAAFLAVFQTR